MQLQRSVLQRVAVAAVAHDAHAQVLKHLCVTVVAGGSKCVAVVTGVLQW